MTRSQAIEQIGKELSGAKRAKEVGNEGMMRVCARRAAGIAIGWWLGEHQREGWGIDAMSRLRAFHLDQSFPDGVRDAAMRLTEKITRQFVSPFPTDPINDCMVIINHLMNLNNPELQ